MAKPPRQLDGVLDCDSLPLVVDSPSGALRPSGIIPMATLFSSGVSTGGGGGGGGSQTFQQVYNAGGAGPQIIQTDALRLGLQIQDTGFGSGSPLLTITDSTAFVFFQFTSNLLTCNVNSLFFSGITVGGQFFPASDYGANIGDNSNHFFNCAAANFLAGATNMKFTCEAPQGGASPAIFQWNPDGGLSTSLVGLIYQFNIGNEPFQLLEIYNSTEGCFIQGYQGGAKRAGLVFNNLGLIVSDFLGGTAINFLPANNGSQFLGLNNNRWILGAAAMAGGFQSSASPITVNASTDRFVGVSGSGVRSVALPAANTTLRGQEVVVQDTGNSNGTITISPNGTDTINGVNAGVTIAVAFGRKVFFSDGISGWFADVAPI